MRKRTMQMTVAGSGCKEKSGCKRAGNRATYSALTSRKSYSEKSLFAKKMNQSIIFDNPRA